MLNLKRHNIHELILKGSDVGVLYLEKSCLWTSSIVQCFSKTQRFGNWICFRLQVE
jgi:hypothetical protein